LPGSKVIDSIYTYFSKLYFAIRGIRAIPRQVQFPRRTDKKALIGRNEGACTIHIHVQYFPVISVFLKPNRPPSGRLTIVGCGTPQEKRMGAPFNSVLKGPKYHCPEKEDRI